MKHLFLINPYAGKYDRTQEVREKLRTVLAGREDPWEVAVTQYPVIVIRWCSVTFCAACSPFLGIYSNAPSKSS